MQHLFFFRLSAIFDDWSVENEIIVYWHFAFRNWTSNLTFFNQPTSERTNESQHLILEASIRNEREWNNRCTFDWCIFISHSRERTWILNSMPWTPEHMIHENHDYTLKYGYLQLPLRKKAFQTIIEWKLYRIYVARVLPIALFAFSSPILLFLKHFTRKWSFNFHSLNFMPTKCY